MIGIFPMTSDARSPSPLEQREKRAIALRMREQGYTYRAIGEAVGVHLCTVAHWVEVAQRQGKPAAHRGRPARVAARRAPQPGAGGADSHAVARHHHARPVEARFCALDAGYGTSK